MKTILNWKSQEIPVTMSRGGKISLCNYEDNLIIPSHSAWPHPDIVKKLYRSNQSKAFDSEALDALSAKLGFYCDLQSLRSEDAITWSIFGTLHYFSKDHQVQFLNSLLEAIGEEPSAKECCIELWTRIAHPDTLVSGGPELDFQIVSDKVVIFGECKWISKVAENQGKLKDKSQLQLRREYLEKYGKRIFPHASSQIVLFVGQEKLLQSVWKSITWDEICDYVRHPLRDEIKHYCQWKKDLGR